MKPREERGSTWQEDVLDALEADPSDRVLLMTQATVWAVRSTSRPLSTYHLVMAASQDAQTLKVCAMPLPGMIDHEVVGKLAAGNRCVLLIPCARVEAVPDPADEMSFHYLLAWPHEDAASLIAEPCKGFRYRDSCSHIDAAPLDTIFAER